MQICHTSPHFLDCTIIVDKSWVFQYVPKKTSQHIVKNTVTTEENKIILLFHVLFL
jgi:hypothetical protein